MSTELMNALKMVADEKSIDIGDLIATIESAVAIAASRRLDRTNLEARFDSERGEFDLYEILEATDHVEDPALQTPIAEARKIDPAAGVGSTVRRRVEMEGLGRIAAQSVRQMIRKKGKEAEAHRLFLTYSGRIGQMVTGRLLRKTDGGYLFDLGDAEGVLPPSEQLMTDRLERGRDVRLVVADVTEGRKEPVIVVSRSSPALLRRLLEMETPEIAEGTVEIAAIARDAAGRSKVAVRGAKKDVDAVGALIGVRGGRIQPIVRELSGEKIDVFAWSDDPKKLITAALTPAKDAKVILDKAGRRADVIVPDEQLSPAIGKKGVNVKLAVKLTRWELDVMSQKEYEEKQKRLAGLAAEKKTGAEEKDNAPKRGADEAPAEDKGENG
ncbi:MAG: transcription termination factor NusA [Candidatus Nitrospinota bacterium M3_3B_026]